MFNNSCMFVGDLQVIYLDSITFFPANSDFIPVCFKSLENGILEFEYYLYHLGSLPGDRVIFYPDFILKSI